MVGVAAGVHQPPVEVSPAESRSAEATSRARRPATVAQAPKLFAFVEALQIMRVELPAQFQNAILQSIEAKQNITQAQRYRGRARFGTFLEMRRIAAAALPVRCAVGMLLTTQRARLSMTAAADPFAKFASGLMRCNQKCFDRVADDLAGRGLPAGAAVRHLGALLEQQHRVELVAVAVAARGERVAALLEEALRLRRLERARRAREPSPTSMVPAATLQRMGSLARSACRLELGGSAC